MSPTEHLASPGPLVDRPDAPTEPSPDTPFVGRLARFDDALAAGAEPPEPLDDDPGLGRAGELLRVVEELLPRHGVWAMTSAQPGGRSTPGRFGRFRVLRELGRGGFGVVFLAYDPVLARYVALKLPRSDVLANDDARKRFLREARAAASLDHAGIVRIYEAGEIGPVAYIASAFIDGMNLAEWLHARTEPVPVGTAAALIADVAEAVQHAHDHEVLHRDLKPANIMLSRDLDGLPGHELRLTAKIADFGLAKILYEVGEDTDTVDGHPIGSFPYMSPEQALGKPSEIGRMADVYSLGVILYQLLTGRVPFRGDSPHETIRQVLEDDAIEPCRLRPGLPRDLQTIVQNCLEKEQGARYASAGELAADLRRFGARQPIVARPPAFWRTAWRWLRKRPAVGGLAASLVLASAGIWSGLAWSNASLRESARRERAHAVEANLHRREAESQSWLNRRALHASRLIAASREREAGRIAEAQAILTQEIPAPGERDARALAWRLMHSLCYKDDAYLPSRMGNVGAMAISGDGQLLATGWNDFYAASWVTIWDPTQPEKPTLARIEGRKRPSHISAMSFSPDHETLAVCEADLKGAPACISLWNALQPSQPLSRVDLDFSSVEGVSFDSEGEFLAVSGTTSAMQARFALFDVRSGVLKRVKAGVTSANQVVNLRDRGLTAICLDPRGGRLVEAATGRAWLTLGPEAAGTCTSAAVSGDDLSLALGQEDGRIVILDTKTGKARLSISLPEGAIVRSLTFSPDSTCILAGTTAKEAYLFDARTGTILRTATHDIRGQIRGTAFTPDGQSFITGGGDHHVAIRQMSPSPNPIIPAGHGNEAWSLSWSPDGKVLASCGDDNLIRLWDARTGHEVGRSPASQTMVSVISYSPDGRQIASGDFGSRVMLWDPKALGEAPPKVIGQVYHPRALAYRPDGRLLVGGGFDGSILAWDPATGRQVAVKKAGNEGLRVLKFNPAGNRLLSAGVDRQIRIWDARSLEFVSSFQACDDEIWSLDFSPDGKHIAVGGKDGHLKIHRLDGSSSRDIGVCGEGIEAVLYLPDGETVATAGLDGRLRLWDVVAKQELLNLGDHGIRLNDLALAPDGRAFASADHGGGIRIWKIDGLPESP
jgi:WD40 repeat protein/serine/threonine protein kinase